MFVSLLNFLRRNDLFITSFKYHKNGKVMLVNTLDITFKRLTSIDKSYYKDT